MMSSGEHRGRPRLRGTPTPPVGRCHHQQLRPPINFLGGKKNHKYCPIKLLMYLCVCRDVGQAWPVPPTAAAWPSSATTTPNTLHYRHVTRLSYSSLILLLPLSRPPKNTGPPAGYFLEWVKVLVCIDMRWISWFSYEYFNSQYWKSEILPLFAPPSG